MANQGNQKTDADRATAPAQSPIASAVAELIFASGGEGAEGIKPADSIADYLRAAASHGFVYYWPRCFQCNPHVSYAEQEAAIKLEIRKERKWEGRTKRRSWTSATR